MKVKQLLSSILSVHVCYVSIITTQTKHSQTKESCAESELAGVRACSPGHAAQGTGADRAAGLAD